MEPNAIKLKQHLKALAVLSNIKEVYLLRFSGLPGQQAQQLADYG